MAYKLNLSERFELHKKIKDNKDVVASLKFVVEQHTKDLEDIDKRIWMLENPPKYKYGDSPGFNLKILEVDLRTIDLETRRKYEWIYKMDDPNEKEIKELTEDEIRYLIVRKKLFEKE